MAAGAVVLPGLLADALAGRRPLLCDGAMGTSLHALGLPLLQAPEHWTLAYPDRVAAVHRAFLEAGADVLLTNSFGGNGARLAAAGLANRVEAVNAGAAGLARREADRAGRPVLVAGSMGPTGMGPPGTDGATRDTDFAASATALFTAQAAALRDGGADLLWIETMSDAAELRAALLGAGTTGLPLVATASFHGAPGGMDRDALLAITASVPGRPVAIGCNCGTGPEDALIILAGLRDAAPGWPLAAKPNAGLPVCHDHAVAWPVSPAQMASFARTAASRGACLIGGCCGTGPAHVSAMREARRAVSP